MESQEDRTRVGFIMLKAAEIHFLKSIGISHHGSIGLATEAAKKYGIDPEYLNEHIKDKFPRLWPLV